jgi:hypothetical protein
MAECKEQSLSSQRKTGSAPSSIVEDAASLIYIIVANIPDTPTQYISMQYKCKGNEWNRGTVRLLEHPSTREEARIIATSHPLISAMDI